MDMTITNGHEVSQSIIAFAAGTGHPHNLSARRFSLGYIIENRVCEQQTFRHLVIHLPLHVKTRHHLGHILSAFAKINNAGELYIEVAFRALDHLTIQVQNASICGTDTLALRTITEHA